jgi:hypothetical protein
MAKSVASTLAGMSAPQGLLVAGAVTGYVSWSYSSAAKLQDAMETQVYVRRGLPTPRVSLRAPRFSRCCCGSRAARGCGCTGLPSAHGGGGEAAAQAGGAPALQGCGDGEPPGRGGQGVHQGQVRHSRLRARRAFSCSPVHPFSGARASFTRVGGRLCAQTRCSMLTARAAGCCVRRFFPLA